MGLRSILAGGAALLMTCAGGAARAQDLPQPLGRANDFAAGAPPAELPQKPKPQADAYLPITGRQRLGWLARKTLGPPNLVAGIFSSAIGTARNQPPEDGPHWSGFGERYGVRLTGIATSNVLEAGLGAVWGEDPRYAREPEKSFLARLTSVAAQTFMTRRRQGQFAPAYARFAAVTGSNFLSNTWRPDSEADSYHAGIRTLLGFGMVMGGNAWDEFWPTVRARVFHRRAPQP